MTVALTVALQLTATGIQHDVTVAHSQRTGTSYSSTVSDIYSTYSTIEYSTV